MTAATALVTANTPSAELAEEAVAEALAKAGLTQARAILLFLTPEFSRQAQAAITAAARRAQCLQVAGSIANGVLTEQGWTLDRPAAAALVLGGGCTLTPREHADTPLLGLASATPSADWLAVAPRFGALFDNSFSGNATASSLWQQGRLSATPHGSLHLSCSEIDIGISTGLKPLGEAQRIGKSAGFELEMLSHQPAARSLLRVLPPEMREAPERHLHHFSALLFDAPPQAGDAGRAVAIIDITSSDAVTLGERIQPDQYLAWAIRQPLAAEADMRDSVSRLAVTQPSFALMFSCIGRGPFFYGGEDRDLMILRERFPGLPILGAYGSGQLAPRISAGKNATQTLHNAVVTALIGQHAD